MGDLEFTGGTGAKKSGPIFGATLFKEARRRESEETNLGVVSGEETTGEKSKVERSVPKGAASSLQDD